MYRKQLTIQKILCMLSVAASVIVFVYALGIMTDLYDSLYQTMMNPRDLTQTMVPGSYVYYEIQGFNQQLLLASIALIVISLLLYVTNTHVRRRYYIGNYFAVLVYAAANIAVAVWSHSQIEIYKAKFLEIDFEALKSFSEMWKSLYTESTFPFDIHYVVFGITIALVVLHILNVVWKILLMQAEDRLVSGKTKTVYDPTSEAIENDRMRYEKNKLSANLALVAIVFNALYFVSIYKSNAGSYYYVLIMGISILYNLLFMLIIFLASEGAKNYKSWYSYVLMIAGVLQIVRIFILPLSAHNARISQAGQQVPVMGNGQFIRVIIYLSLSAVCCIAAGITLKKKSADLNAHLAALKN